MDQHCELIMQEYLNSLPSLLVMKEAVLSMLKTKISSSGLIVAGIEGRVKTEKSLRGKLELKGMKYQNLFDITDIIGARIITFYSDEVDVISALIEKLFIIDRVNSIDKRKIFDLDRFGYMSLHYICQIPKEVFYDENYPIINELRFEIQIKTALQHVWATIHHDLGYKTDIEIPKEYSRKLFRLASLLELADSEFYEFRTDIEKYRRNVNRLMELGQYNKIELNGDSFRKYIDLNPFNPIIEKIAMTINAEVNEASMLPYLLVLQKIGIKTIGDVEKLKEKYKEEAIKLSIFQLEGKDLDIISSTIAIQNLCYIYVVKNGGLEKDIKQILDCLYGEKERNINSAKRIFAQLQKLGMVTSREK